MNCFSHERQSLGLLSACGKFECECRFAFSCLEKASQVKISYMQLGDLGFVSDISSARRRLKILLKLTILYFNGSMPLLGKFAAR